MHSDRIVKVMDPDIVVMGKRNSETVIVGVVVPGDE